MVYLLWGMIVLLLGIYTNWWILLGFIIVSGFTKGILVMSESHGDYDFITPLFGFFIIIGTILAGGFFLLGKFVF